jgi:hypothetical protein
MESHPRNRNSQADWFPDWLSSNQAEPSARNHTTTTYLQPASPPSELDSFRLSNISNGASDSSKVGTVEDAEAGEQIPSALPEDELIIERNRDRAVKYAIET